jgi:hypothetical protein
MPRLPLAAHDRTGLLGATGALLVGIPAWLAASYLFTRLAIPVLLIIFATRQATPALRIRLVTDYLIGPRPASDGVVRWRERS